MEKFKLGDKVTLIDDPKYKGIEGNIIEICRDAVGTYFKIRPTVKFKDNRIICAVAEDLKYCSLQDKVFSIKKNGKFSKRTKKQTNSTPEARRVFKRNI